MEDRECCRKTLLTFRSSSFRDIQFVSDQTKLRREEMPKYFGTGCPLNDLHHKPELVEGHAEVLEFREMERLAPDHGV